jgi:hypothetical protein
MLNLNFPFKFFKIVFLLGAQYHKNISCRFKTPTNYQFTGSTPYLAISSGGSRYFGAFGNDDGTFVRIPADAAGIYSTFRGDLPKVNVLLGGDAETSTEGSYSPGPGSLVDIGVFTSRRWPIVNFVFRLWVGFVAL